MQIQGVEIFMAQNPSNWRRSGPVSQICAKDHSITVNGGRREDVSHGYGDSDELVVLAGTEYKRVELRADMGERESERGEGVGLYLARIG